ncbi:TfoX/Sxy family protein [Nocardioides sp. GXQ0305]|uniref:TfoX/Sxy family protein n=1 Tax=Nocardioides sp. GXQ0305 TaxID=3423912 RepID=UPI003D7DEA9B
MAYDEELAGRVRSTIGGEDGLEEKRMFGGLAFLVDGHMAVGVSGQGGLMVRVDPAAGEALVDGVGVVPMEMRGRAMTGWLRVTAEAVASDEALAEWARRGVAHARTLPPKD